MNTRCFVDVNGHIWSVDQNNKSNFPSDINIDGDTVQILGAEDDFGDGREIEEEYQLWPSLTSLAKVIETD